MTAELIDEARRPVRLGTVLGRGGEGTVLALADEPSSVAKLFAPARRTPEKHDKLHTMIRRPPPGATSLIEGYPVLAWPTRLLYWGRPGRTSFAGYVMPRVQVENDFLPLHEVFSSRRRAAFGGARLGLRHLLLIGLRVAHVVRTLHSMRYAVGDLNDRNVLVSRRLTPLFVDADSFQVPRGLFGHFACGVGDRLYWPPELLDVNLTAQRPDRTGSDRYALAVLIFQLLMDGHRPYQARGRLVEALETLDQKTRAGHYPWARPRPGRLEPPAGAPEYGRLPRTLRTAFDAAFIAGHSRPRHRPSADEWYKVLRKALEAVPN